MQITCTDCEAGRFQDLTGQTNCSRCSAGSVSGSPASTECTACPAGRFVKSYKFSLQDGIEMALDDTTLQTACTDCAKGKVQANAGSTECGVCSPGRYANFSGMKNCIDCPVNYYNDETSQFESSRWWCEACPAGSSTKGYTKSEKCSLCSYGKFSKSAKDCVDCRIGKVAPDLGSVYCKACSSGSYTPDTVGAIECKLCENLGEARTSLRGSLDCLRCEEHYYWDDNVGCNGLTGDAEHSQDLDVRGENGYTGCCKSCRDLEGYDDDPTISSVVCEEGSMLTSLVVNPGWWRSSPTSSDIYKCPTSDCRSSGGEATIEKPFGAFDMKKGKFDKKDLPRLAGNATGTKLCQGHSHGPLCGICDPGAYRYTTDDVSVCVKCAKGNVFMVLSQVPPKTWIMASLVILLLIRRVWGGGVPDTILSEGKEATNERFLKAESGKEESKAEEKDGGDSEHQSMKSVGKLGDMMSKINTLASTSNFSISGIFGDIIIDKLEEEEEDEDGDEDATAKVFGCSKIVFQAYQIMCSFQQRFFKVKFPPLYSRISSFIGTFVAFDLEVLFPFSRECATKRRHDLFYFDFFLYTLTPLIFGAMCVAIYKIRLLLLEQSKPELKLNTRVKVNVKEEIGKTRAGKDIRIEIAVSKAGKIVKIFNKGANFDVELAVEDTTKKAAKGGERINVDREKIEDVIVGDVGDVGIEERKLALFDSLSFTLLFASYLIFTAVSTKICNFFGTEWIITTDFYEDDETVSELGVLPSACEGDSYNCQALGYHGAFPCSAACREATMICVLRADYSTRCDTASYQAMLPFAILMFFIYPIGIPLVYLVLVRQKYSDINPDLPDKRDESVKEEMKEAKSSRKIAATMRKELEVFEGLANNAKGDVKERKRLQGKIEALKLEIKLREEGERPKDARWHLQKANLNDSHTGPEAVDEVIIMRNQRRDLVYIKFLFEAYEPHCWGYEVYECVRRLLQTALNVFFFPGTNLGIAINVFFSFIFFKISAHYSPYLQWEQDFLGEMSQWLILFQLQITLLFSTGVVDPYGPVGTLFVGITASLLGAVFVVVSSAMKRALLKFGEQWFGFFRKLPRKLRDYWSMIKHMGSRFGGNERGEAQVEPSPPDVSEAESAVVETFSYDEAQYSSVFRPREDSPSKIFTARPHAWTSRNDPLPSMLPAPLSAEVTHEELFEALGIHKRRQEKEKAKSSAEMGSRRSHSGSGQ